MTAVPSVINVQPHPRLLGILGDIEFAPWQCLAELVDNAFDEFLRQPAGPRGSGEDTVDAVQASATSLLGLQIVPQPPTVWVTLPSRGSAARDAEVWVKDNGPGMTLDQLNNALRAGWTSNDRYGHLGLFGVGFNIATARLGHLAVVRTARAENPVWTVVTIDLRALASGGHFDLPVTTEPKASPADHGTEVVIRQLKPEHHDQLSRQQGKIRAILGDVYSYLISDKGFHLIVDRERVKPRRPCVWDESRSVVRRGDRIPAVISIDKRLADRHACLNCGLWQDEPEDGLCVSCGSANLEVQERRIWGWLGIQRYLSPTDFGIDFIRNGRKILIRDTSLFRWVDPDDPGGRGDPEYPMEVPTGAGRIVGEIHIDHVRVNYQKNAFEYETPDWKTVVRTLRGDGPILPKSATNHGYGLNTSPLGRLVTGYRRNDPGLNYLTPGDGKNALHERAREWAERFRKGDPEYQTDEKWYQAAQQHDEPPAPPTDPVDEPTDILGAKGLNPPPPSPNGTPPPPRPQPTQVETEEDRRARWRDSGHLMPDLDAKFGLRGQGAALQVTAWLVHGQRLRRPDDPERIPVYVASGKGSAVEVFVDAEHPIFTDFAVDTRDLVVIELAEFLRVRNRTTERSLSAMFYDLKEQCLPDHKVTGPALSTNAGRLLTRVREGMQPVIAGNAAGYWSLVNPEDQAAAERTFALEGGFVNWEDVLSSGDWIDYAPGGSLARLVSARPESFLDGRVFRSAHQSLTDVEARKVSAERIVDLLGDVAVLADRPASRRGTSEELQRSRLSCVLLEQELATGGDGS